MPSLWKKQKGSNISRSVVDPQTSPKHHKTLVVENVVSLGDVLGHNKDKIKKLSKKKRSKKHNPTTITIKEHTNSFSISGTINGVDQPMFKHMEIKREESAKDITEAVSNNDINSEKEVRENDVSMNRIELDTDGKTSTEDGNNEGCSKLNINQVYISSSSSSEEEKLWTEIVCEIDTLEQNYSVWPRQNQSIPCIRGGSDSEQLRKTQSKGKTKIADNCFGITNPNDKRKKRRKFWKKLVPRHVCKNKKNKYGEEFQDRIYVAENETEFEETEMEEMDDSSEENEDGKEHFTAKESNHNHEIELVNGESKYDIAMVQKDFIFKGLIAVMIPLIGLISGRVFAFVLTLIGCVMFKKLLRD